MKLELSRWYARINLFYSITRINGVCKTGVFGNVVVSREKKDFECVKGYKIPEVSLCMIVLF